MFFRNKKAKAQELNKVEEKDEKISLYERIKRGIDLKKSEDNSKIKRFEFEQAEGVSNMMTTDSVYGKGFGMQEINYRGVPESLLSWYIQQSFIGHYVCAILSQQWLVNKACTTPVKDAVRNGYRVMLQEDESETPDQDNNGKNDAIEYIEAQDKKHNIINTMIDFERHARIYGVAYGLFLFEGVDDEFYELPFNIDGVKPNSYKGIKIVDPIYIFPEPSAENTDNPASPKFYNPDLYLIGTKKYHRSHLCILIPNPVPDIAKPMYRYGGIPLTQMIYERVYASERTANEAPQLALTKRTGIVKTSSDDALQNKENTVQALSLWAEMRNNYGALIIGEQEDYVQHDVSLADFDSLVMTQYQLVASIANVPATKLLGTEPKGFNATGDYAEENYRQELESIQENHLTPLLSRHHEYLLKSGGFNASVDVQWRSTDSPTAVEKATILNLQADADGKYIQMGALTDADVRERLSQDEDSMYSGIGKYEEDDIDGYGELTNGEIPILPEETEANTE